MSEQLPGYDSFKTASDDSTPAQRYAERRIQDLTERQLMRTAVDLGLLDGSRIFDDIHEILICHYEEQFGK